MSENEMPTVFVVEDDDAYRRTLCRIMEGNNLPVRAFATGEAFLEQKGDYGPGCLLLDVNLPGINGLELQRGLQGRASELPIIFLTGHGDIPMTVDAMRSGAVDFLAKPVSIDKLLATVRRAFELNAIRREGMATLRLLQKNYELLTPREREVMTMVVAGRLNREIGDALGITERTVKAHRAQIMIKMRVDSLAELVRAAQRLNV